MLLVFQNKDDRLVLALQTFLSETGTAAEIISHRDAFGLVSFSIDDVDAGELDIEEIAALTNDEKEAFLVYAEKQLSSDLAARGGESLRAQYDLWRNNREPDGA